MMILCANCGFLLEAPSPKSRAEKGIAAGIPKVLLSFAMEADLPQAGGMLAQGPSKFKCALSAATGGMAGIPAAARRASSPLDGARLPIPKTCAVSDQRACHLVYDKSRF
jgi:hypothetical protein